VSSIVAPAMSFMAPAVPLPAVLSAFDPFLMPVMLTVLRHINIVVPAVAYEIDRPAAGVVSAAVLVPLFRMSGRNVHVDRLRDNGDRRLDHNGLRIDDLRLGKISDVDMAVKTGTDRH